MRDEPRAPGSPVVAVLAGFAVDVGGTLLSGVVSGIVYAVILASRGSNEEEIAAAMSAITPGSGLFLAIALAGFAFSFLGGFFCARIARRNEYRLGAVLALLSMAVGVVFSSDGNGVSTSVALLASTAVAVMLGAAFGRSRNLAQAR